MQRRGLFLSPIGAALVLAALLLAATLAGALWPNPGAGGPGIGGPFALLDGDGRTITDRDFRGRWMLVYFGYTHCPDACPTALGDIAGALAQLPPAARARVAPVFVTVDPARDTPAVMKDYVSAFGVPIAALSGAPAAVEAMERAYRVYAARHPAKDGGYEMDHSSIIYLMDPRGRFVTGFGHESGAGAIAARLKALGA